MTDWLLHWISPEGALALCAAGALWQSWRAKRHAADASAEIAAVAKDVRQVELATNSMKDALIIAAGLAGEARGREAEAARQAEGKGT